MAHVIKSPDQTPVSRQVPWGEYANGRWWNLVAGEDFGQESRKAARAARQWASNHGYRCRVVFVDKGPNKGDIQIRFEKVEL